MRSFPRALAVSMLFAPLISLAQTPAPNVVIRWDNAAVQAIRDLKPPPTASARALAILHTAIYDAWAAYDQKALGSRFGGSLRRPAAERTEPNKVTAINYAAHRVLVDLFPLEKPKFDDLMRAQGLQPDDPSTNSDSPLGIGNKVALALLEYRHGDGSNQLGDLHAGAYSDYTDYAPVNGPARINDPNRWQPLVIRGPTGDGKLQFFETPQWYKVQPFALSKPSQFRPQLHPADFHKDRLHYIKQTQDLLDIAVSLTDEQKIIAEYWADGPSSEQPPGHWCVFAQFISARDHHTLDRDVQMFFALSNALFDASIAAWDAKRTFDSVRPITAVQYLESAHRISVSNFKPYLTEFTNMPAFPEYVSGHSTFSAAAAEVLKRFTGSDDFGDQVTIPKGGSKVEPGSVPKQAVVLKWPTFSVAADQAGISRRYCGIHFEDGDLQGRRLGRLVATAVWNKTQSMISGALRGEQQ